MRISRNVCMTKVLFRPNWVLAVGAVLLAGGVYRVAASRLNFLSGTVIVLPVPLSSFPTEINGWAGEDVPIPKYIQRIAGSDDFLYRLYTNKSTGQWASVYVAYSGRPRTMLGHRPDVCYVAEGWVHESSVGSELRCPSGRLIPCSIHRFHKPTLSHEETVVLNFYVLNGQITRSESGFSGVGWRTPNIAGDPARYVTQVQISSVLENSVRAAAADLTETILDFFPDSSGSVRAADVSIVQDAAK